MFASILLNSKANYNHLLKKRRFGFCPAAKLGPKRGNNSFDSTWKILDNDHAKALNGHNYALFFK